MKNLSQPLSDQELDFLSEFLINRFGEDDDAEPIDPDIDEGILDISELDGFLTAIVSGPSTVMPSTWLSALWGANPPEWRSQKEFETVLSLLMRHMNSIAALLNQNLEDFAPMYNQRTVDGKVYDIVDEWCDGYMRAVHLTEPEWGAGGLEVSVLLVPIRAFTEETRWAGHELATEEESDNVRKAIPPSVRALYSYWLERRESGRTPVQTRTLRHEGPRPGRNDPCPCGSGKKYKKCCLQ